MSVVSWRMVLLLKLSILTAPMMTGCQTINSVENAPQGRQTHAQPVSERESQPDQITTSIPDNLVKRLPAPPDVADLNIIVGYSNQKRPIRAKLIGEGENVILFLATIHGNESAGTPLMRELVEYLLANPAEMAGRRVIVMPVCNPDGLAAGSRLNARGVDLNRNYPAANRRNGGRGGAAALSEPESVAMMTVLQRYPPSVVVSLHQPLSCVDWDGPGAELAGEMAALCGLDAKKLGARPGSLGSYVGIELGVPIVTLELPRSADEASPSELWGRYGQALLAAIRYEAR